MRSIVLKGVEITIGSKVRFVDDSQLYEGYVISKPTIGQVYIVRDFSKKNGFLLEEVHNELVHWTDEEGNIEGFGEPGFAVWRFEPAQNSRKKKIVRIEILPMVEERVDILQPEK